MHDSKLYLILQNTQNLSAAGNKYHNFSKNSCLVVPNDFPLIRGEQVSCSK